MSPGDLVEVTGIFLPKPYTGFRVRIATRRTPPSPHAPVGAQLCVASTPASSSRSFPFAAPILIRPPPRRACARVS